MLPSCENCGRTIRTNHCYKADDDGTVICEACVTEAIKLLKPLPVVADAVENFFYDNRTLTIYMEREDYSL